MNVFYDDSISCSNLLIGWWLDSCLCKAKFVQIIISCCHDKKRLSVTQTSILWLSEVLFIHYLYFGAHCCYLLKLPAISREVFSLTLCSCIPLSGNVPFALFLHCDNLIRREFVCFFVCLLLLLLLLFIEYI